jgi:muramoyltetrapeptide carboxypeptidase LdcA involved in peptidoglycan recycling
MERLATITGLVPVECPITRRLGASAGDRAADLNAAFADPEIRAVLATIGGEDQITVVPLLDPEIVRTVPKPFLGYSDNTNVLNLLWNHGVVGLYGGSTRVHLGSVLPWMGCTPRRCGRNTPLDLQECCDEI